MSYHNSCVTEIISETESTQVKSYLSTPLGSVRIQRDAIVGIAMGVTVFTISVVITCVFIATCIGTVRKRKRLMRLTQVMEETFHGADESKNIR